MCVFVYAMRWEDEQRPGTDNSVSLHLCICLLTLHQYEAAVSFLFQEN